MSPHLSSPLRRLSGVPLVVVAMFVVVGVLGTLLVRVNTIATESRKQSQVNATLLTAFARIDGESKIALLQAMKCMAGKVSRGPAPDEELQVCIDSADIEVPKRPPSVPMDELRRVERETGPAGTGTGRGVITPPPVPGPVITPSPIPGPKGEKGDSIQGPPGVTPEQLAQFDRRISNLEGYKTDHERRHEEEAQPEETPQPDFSPASSARDTPSVGHFIHVFLVVFGCLIIGTLLWLAIKKVLPIFRKG